MVADFSTTRLVLQTIDLGLTVAGGGVALGGLVWWIRRGRWRDPLAGVPWPARGPTITDVAVVLLALVAVQTAVFQLWAAPGATGEDLAPGTSTWLRVQAADAVTKLVVSALIVVLLARARRAAGEPDRDSATADSTPNDARVSHDAITLSCDDESSSRAWADPSRAQPGAVPPPIAPPPCPFGPLRGTAAALMGLLVFLPVSEAQLRLGRAVWGWFYPQAAPPEHPVLQALGQGACGTWGTGQLLLGALVVAPLVEELFFRGLLLPAIWYHLRRAWLAIVLSAVAFGLVHAQPQDVLPLVTMGVLLGYLRVRGQALWPCVLLHMVFNARTMTYVLLAPELAAS